MNIEVLENKRMVRPTKDYKAKYMEALDQLEANQIALDKSLCLLTDLLNGYDTYVDDLEDDQDLKFKWIYDYKSIVMKLEIIHDYNLDASREIEEIVKKDM